MMGHTPGPWRRDDLTIYVLEEIDGLPTNRFWASVQRQRGSISLTEMEANAKLIAAAPSLADALEGVREHFNSHGDCVDSSCWWDPMNAALRLAGRL